MKRLHSLSPRTHSQRPRLVGVVILLLLSCTAGAADRPRSITAFFETAGPTRVIAHRGFSGRAPENTVAAVHEAVSIGADMAEVDVTLTADGEVVCLHDEKLQRTTNGRGLVSTFTLAELRTLDAGSWFSPHFTGEPIPTLDEVLDSARDKILLDVEIKSEAVAGGVTAKVVAAIRTKGMVDQVVVSSFSPAALKEMRTLAPEVRTIAIFNRKLHKRGTDPVDVVRGVGADSFAINRKFITDEMVRRCRANGITIAVYTVNKKRHMRKTVQAGIHAIFTDHPDLLLEVLRDFPTAR